VNFTTVGHVAIITIDRPEARNAINGVVAQGLEAGLDRLEADPDLWVGVLTSTPPVFCAGADLKEIQAGHRDRLRTPRGGFAGFVARRRSKPIIAAVEGMALAGGTEICLACDLIVASHTAKFGIPEVKRGLVAAAGGLFRLPSRLPKAIALELVMTGEPIDAESAARFGMINRLVEPGRALDTAVELAQKIAANAPIAVRASRRVLLDTASPGEATGFELSEEAMGEAMASDDMREGVAAFVEKRPPIWSGR
jgi:enoyl-CoA hydratase